jgi:large subunit ribosomal protein L25
MGLTALTKLSAQAREELGSSKARRMRLRGSVPVVLYGHGEKTQHLVVGARDLEQLVGSGQRVLSLETPQGVQQALLRAVQFDALGKEILHADFTRVALDEAVTVEVPVELFGQIAEAGVVNQLLHALEVKCRADAIPGKVRVDIGGRHTGDVIRVKELTLPEGVQAVPEGEVVVVSIAKPEELEVVAAPAEGAAEPEVIRAEREKEEKEAAGGAAPEKAEKPEKPSKSESKEKE